MKKIALCLVLVFHALSARAQIQIIEKISSFNSWSVATEIGLNHFNGDLMSTPAQRFRGIISSPGMNISIEHNIDPVFSVGWDIGMTMFNMTGERPRGTGNDDEIIYFEGYTSTPFLAANLLALTRRGRVSNWGVYAKAGIGFAGYSRQFTSMRNPSTGVVDTIVDFKSRNQERVKDRIMRDGVGVRSTEMSLYVPLTLSVEYALTNNLSVGAYGKFVITNSDYLESISRHQNVDYWQSGGVTIRYKFTRENAQHSRNILYGEEVRTNAELLATLRSDVDTLIVEVDTIQAQMRKCDCDDLRLLNERLLKLERELENRPIIQVQPSVRDTVVIIRETVPVEKPLPTVRLAVFFDFDKTDLDREALETIRKVAEIMKDDPTLNVEIRGFADNPGGRGYNQRLSERRSERVKAELVRVYGINPNRIEANGRGQLDHPPAQTRENRRCEFFFSR